MKRDKQNSLSKEPASFVDIIACALEKSRNEPRDEETAPPRTESTDESIGRTRAKSITGIQDGASAPPAPDHLALEGLLPLTGQQRSDGEVSPHPPTVDDQTKTPSEAPHRHSRLRSVWLGLMIIGVIALATVILFQVAPTTAVYPFFVRDIGRSVDIVSPYDGSITEVSVLPGQFVNQGELLMRMRKHHGPQFLALQQEYAALSLDLAKHQEGFAKPDHVHTEILRQIELAEQKALKLRAELAANQKQLRTIRSRLWGAESLYKQGIVYEGGVYTLALKETLQTTAASLADELKQKEQEANAALDRVEEHKQKLQRHDERQAEHLRLELDQKRSQIAALKDRIHEQELQVRQLSITAPADGLIEAAGVTTAADNVRRGAILMNFRAFDSRLSVMVEENSQRQDPQLSIGAAVQVRFALPNEPYAPVYQGIITDIGMGIAADGDAADRLSRVPAKLALAPNAPSTLLRDLTSLKAGEMTVPMTTEERFRYIANRSSEWLRARVAQLFGW